MGFLDAYEGAVEDYDGNYNYFVAQHIQMRLNGSETVHVCLRRALALVSGMERSTLRPHMNLKNDLGLSDKTFLYLLRILEDSIIFMSGHNPFYDWFMAANNFRHDNGHWGQFIDITIAQLEELIESGHPMSAAKLDKDVFEFME